MSRGFVGKIFPINPHLIELPLENSWAKCPHTLTKTYLRIILDYSRSRIDFHFQLLGHENSNITLKSLCPSTGIIKRK